MPLSEMARDMALARVMVYRPATMPHPDTAEPITPPFFGTEDGLRLLGLKPAAGTEFEVDENELDENWLYRPTPKQ
jgi:hypothetical protein